MLIFSYEGSFEWDDDKNLENQQKHGVSFEDAIDAFKDPKKIIIEDDKHSSDFELRYFCIGEVNNKILTVRFVYRADGIRIFGAGYWRKRRRFYLVKNKL